MSTLEDQEVWHVEVTKREKTILEVARSWIAIGKLLGIIFIAGGSVYVCLDNDNNVIFDLIVGFVLCSLLVSAVQLTLLGFPFGLVLGAPCGAVLGVLLTAFKSSLPGLPSWWPSEWLWSAAYGAVGGTIFLGGFVGWNLAERVGWWPLSAYWRTFGKLRKFVSRRTISIRESPTDAVHDNEKAEDGDEANPGSVRGAPNPSPTADGWRHR